MPAKKERRKKPAFKNTITDSLHACQRFLPEDPGFLYFTQEDIRHFVQYSILKK